MITFREMMRRVGQEKAIDIAVHNRPGEKTNFEKTRGIKGRVKFRTCKHGNWIIENYEPKDCYLCILEAEVKPNVFSFRCDTREYFNIGTGTYGTTSEHRKYARSKGLEEAG